MRDGRFGAYIQLGEQGDDKDDQAETLVPAARAEARGRDAREGARLARPCRAKWRNIPRAASRSSPASAATGLMCSTSATYANLGRDDDMLEIGGNRAIDLIVEKESGGGGGRFGGSARPGPRARRPSRRRRHRGEGRTLRPLCELGQDQRDAAERHEPRRADDGRGHRVARRPRRAARLPAADAWSANIRAMATLSRATGAMAPMSASARSTPLCPKALRRTAYRSRTPSR